MKFFALKIKATKWSAQKALAVVEVCRGKVWKPSITIVCGMECGGAGM